MNDDIPAWPLSLRVLHWASGALVIGALGLGAYMVEVVQDPAERFDLTQTHKSIGIAVLALTMVRLCLRIVTTAPRPERVEPRLMQAAKAAHISLYALLLLMPLSGWLMATTTLVRVPTFVFGFFELPYPLASDLRTYGVVHAVHVTAAILLSVLVVLHVAAALAHALWWRDRTLLRMWGTPRLPRASRTPIRQIRYEDT
jgi:cytochrome b561